MFTGKKKAACAAMLSMAMVAPLAAFAENETRVITCGTLNLRAEESASSKILGKYGWGSEVLVKGVNGDWASVDVGGQSGYMYAKYLGREGTTNSTAYVKTNSRGLNLRAEPNGNILGSYPRGTKVTVLATTGEWSKVSVDGKTGYMQSRWLSGKAVSGGSSAVSPAVGTAVVNNPRDTQVLFLRREANVSSESLGYYRNGKTVTLLARQGDWYKVSVDGKTGYMQTQWLSTKSVSSGSSTVKPATGTAVVNNPRDTQVLFLRREASMNSESLGYYRNGKTVTLLARQGDWYKVSVDGKTGFMMAKYLKVTSEVVSGTARVFNANGGSYVNFRSRASLSASVIGTVPVGTTVKVLEKTTDWTKVEVNGQTGYISTWFLKF